MILMFGDDGDLLCVIPKGWDKFVFRGRVYRVVFGTVVRGEAAVDREATKA